MSKESDFVKAYEKSGQKKASNHTDRLQSRKKNIQGEGTGLYRRNKFVGGANGNVPLTGEIRPNQYGQFGIPHTATGTSNTRQKKGANK